MNKPEFMAGIKSAVPIVLGYMPLGFAFGILAVEVGLNVAQATIMSIFCFSGAGQYIALGVIQAGAAPITAIIANILVNLRYFLFSSSLVQYYKGNVPINSTALLSYGLTDETYAVAMTRYMKVPPSTSYIAGLNFTSHLGWIGSTYAGAVLGALVSDTQKWGLDFALPAMYICLLILMTLRRTDIIVAVIAAGVTLLIGYVFPHTIANLSNMIIATFIAATLGVIIHRAD